VDMPQLEQSAQTHRLQSFGGDRGGFGSAASLCHRAYHAGAFVRVLASSDVHRGDGALQLCEVCDDPVEREGGGGHFDSAHDARPLSAAAHAASPTNTRPPAISATAATPAPVAGSSVTGRWQGWKNRAVLPRRSNTPPTPS